jgi:inactivated superfamily I helicase
VVAKEWWALIATAVRVREAAMTDDRIKGSNTRKDPDEWTTGDEPMTGAQASYLKTLSEEAKEPFDDGLTKAEASKRIDELQRKTGRGRAASELGTER